MEGDSGGTVPKRSRSELIDQGDEDEHHEFPHYWRLGLPALTGGTPTTLEAPVSLSAADLL